MDRKKHICLIYEFLSEQGGLEREIITHARFLKDAGYKVTILTCHIDKKILSLLPFDGLDIKYIGKIRMQWEAVNIGMCLLGISNLSRIKADAFLSYSFPANFLIRSRKEKKINYVNHFPHFLYLNEEEKKEWASGTEGRKRWIAVWISKFCENYLKRLDKNLLTKNDLIFMNSEFTKKRLEKLYGINETIVSYPPLDKRFSKEIKPRKREPFIFGSSRIIPDKKYEWLIDAVGMMKRHLPLRLAGSVEPGYRKKLEEHAKKRKVDIKFLGRLNTEEIRQEYADAAVFAFPTPGEDFGLVPAESLACGTPVVVWGDGAGPTEQIIDGVNGYWAKPYDKKDFAEKIEMVLKSGMKKNNRKKIIESSKKFSYEEVKKLFLREVEKALNK